MSDLARFVVAQGGGVWEQALAELRAGAKHGHWMWFIFPQIAGLGRSDMAMRYALANRAEAAAYLAHPQLGPRLGEAVSTLLDLPPHTDIARVMGAVDALKLRSSLTLFEAAGAGPAVAAALDRFYAGARDPLTLARL